MNFVRQWHLSDDVSREVLGESNLDELKFCTIKLSAYGDEIRHTLLADTSFIGSKHWEN